MTTDWCKSQESILQAGGLRSGCWKGGPLEAPGKNVSGLPPSFWRLPLTRALLSLWMHHPDL